jgi:hypothetical protein
MKRILTLLIILMSSKAILAQDSSQPQKVNINLVNRGSDHLMLQYGFDGWAGTPDSIRTKGFSRHFNIYFMFDKPFKTSPHFSVAYGAGIGSSNIFFNNTYVDLKATGTATLPFRNVDSSNHFSKYKLTTIFLEAPVELRYYSNLADPNKSVKLAVGVKVGTMIKAFTKGKNLLDKSGNTVYGAKYIQKEVERKFFNGTKLAVTARVGYGIWGLHAAYQVTQLLKEGTGGEIRPWSIGFTISGL